MTIAAGFRCKDGVVLCADTEMSDSLVSKHPESKILKLSHNAFITYAGDRDFMHQVFPDLRAAFVKPVAQEIDVIANLRYAWEEINQEMLRRAQQAVTDPCLYLVVALTVENRVQLYLGNGPNFSPVNKYTAIGIGKDVARAFIEPLYSQNVSLQQAALISALALKQAKTFVGGCGGSSEIVLIEDGPLALHALTWEQPEQLEQDFLYLQTVLRPLFLAFPATLVEPRDFAELLKTVNNKLKEYHLAAYTREQKELKKAIRELEQFEE